MRYGVDAKAITLCGTNFVTSEKQTRKYPLRNDFILSHMYCNSTERKAIILENLCLPLDVSVAIGFEFDGRHFHFSPSRGVASRSCVQCYDVGEPGTYMNLRRHIGTCVHCR